GAANAWVSLAGADPRQLGHVRESFAQLVRFYYDEDRASFERQAVLTRGVVEGEIEGWTDVDRRKLYLESIYGRWRPFQLAFFLFIASCLLWGAAILRIGIKDREGAQTRVSALAMGLTYLG